MSHGHGRSLASPQFPDDDGQVYPELAAALGDDVAVLQAIANVRLFVPIVAILGDYTPSEGDKNSDMAAVLMKGADGRQALLAFSSVQTMATWDPKARPVPIMGRDAAKAALDEGASAIVLDLANPGFTVIETDDVNHLAQGHTLTVTDAGPAWIL